MTSIKAIGRRLYEGWLLIAARFGEAQTLIIVAFVYGAVLGPMSVGMRIGRGDPLHKRGLRAPGSAWHEADSVTAPALERAKRLF